MTEKEQIEQLTKDRDAWREMALKAIALIPCQPFQWPQPQPPQVVPTIVPVYPRPYPWEPIITYGATTNTSGPLLG